jgi:hypothetical protein
VWPKIGIYCKVSKGETLFEGSLSSQKADFMNRKLKEDNSSFFKMADV